jgi:hypothetical protein
MISNNVTRCHRVKQQCKWIFLELALPATASELMYSIGIGNLVYALKRLLLSCRNSAQREAQDFQVTETVLLFAIIYSGAA